MSYIGTMLAVSQYQLFKRKPRNALEFWQPEYSAKILVHTT